MKWLRTLVLSTDEKEYEYIDLYEWCMWAPCVLNLKKKNKKQNQCFFFLVSYKALLGFPGGSVVKNLPANAGDTGDAGSNPGLGDCWRRKWQHVPVFSPGESHGQRSLAGYSLQRETTERAHTQKRFYWLLLYVYPSPTALRGYLIFSPCGFKTTWLIPHNSIFPSSQQVNQLR